jgi:Tfp pilus assembly protein PilF
MLDSRHLRKLKQRLDVKQFDAALLSANSYARAEPGNPMAHYWVGYCYMRLRQPAEAEEPLRRALSINGSHPESLSLLGRCLIGQGRHREALETARNAEALQSDNPEVWDAIGVVYGQLNEYADAARVFRRIQRLRPENSRNLFNLASMLNYCHETEEAEKIYRRALELYPTRFLNYWSLSQMKKQTIDDNNIDWLRARLARYAREPDAPLHINLALAKELEDIGDYASSFSHLEAGMNCKRARLEYMPEQDQRLFATIQRTFNREFCQREHTAADNAEAIFIVGMPRTGTTLLEQIIAAHSEVFAAGELQHFFAAWMSQARPQLPRISPEAAMAFGTSLDFRRLGEDYIASTRPRTGRTARFIDKMPNNFLYLGAIATALPRAKIIHMTRDPMDTCYANYKQLFGRSACPYSYTQVELAEYYRLYRNLMDHWEDCFPGRIYAISYEELVEDTETTAREVLARLELDWQPRCLEFHTLKQAVGTASTAQVRQPVYRSSVQKWRHYEAQLAPMREIIERG